MPTNEKASLIAIGSKGDKMYYSILDLDINSEVFMLPVLKEVEQSELVEVLKDKFGEELNNRPSPRF